MANLQLEAGTSKTFDSSNQLDATDTMDDDNMLDIEEELKKLDGGNDVKVIKAVSENKSKRSSLAGKNISNVFNFSPEHEDDLDRILETSEPIEAPKVDPGSIRSLANGSLPKTGKPMMLTLEKNTKRKMTKARGRPKQKAMVAMYQSQIKDNNLGIKLRITKSDLNSKSQPAKTKPVRKRSRKSKQPANSDTEGSDYEKKRKKDKGRSNNNTEKDTNSTVPKQTQSVFAVQLPEHILYRVSVTVEYGV